MDTTATVVDTPTVQPLAAYPLVNSQPPVRAIDGHQLFELHQKFVTTPLPTKAMFPWLHGVDGTSNPQNYFFGIQHQHYAGCAATGGVETTDNNNNPATATATTPRLPLPEHRGLMFVHANELDLGRLVGSVSPSEILQPVPPSPRSSPASSSRVSAPASSSIEYSNGNTNGSYDINNHPQLHHHHTTTSATSVTQGGIATVSNSDWADISDDLTSSSLSSSSLSSTSSSSFNNNTIGSSNGATTGTGSGNGGAFDSSSTSSSSSAASHPLARKLQSSFMHSLSEGINIRNFKIQVPRYALLSDLIIYAKDGEQDIYILQLAKQISTAQEEVFRAMKEQYPQMSLESRRQTFILTDSFAAFEAKYPDLVAISNGGRNSKNKVDFWEQEREQMSLLTRGSEIAPGIWLGNSSDVPQQNNANNNSSALATPVSPGSSFQSYFFSSSSASSTIPNTISQATSSANNNNNNKKSTAIPTTPPPETTNDYYPPLTPPSFSDQTNFHPSICVECRSGANAPTTFTLDRIKTNVACTPAPLSFKEIFHLECSGSLTAGVNPEAFPPSTSSLSSFARQENVDVAANQTMRRATAAGLVSGYQMINTMLQTQITHLVNMAFFINQVTSGTSVTGAATAVASGLSSPTSPSSPPSFNNGFSAGRQSPSAQQQQQRAHQVLIHCVDGYTETALLALATVMVHYRFTLAEAYVKMQTDLGRSFFVYPNDAIMMLEVEAQIWQRLVSEKNGGGLSTASKSAIPGASPSTSSSGMSSLSSSVSSTSSSFFSSLLNMSNQPSQQGPQDGSEQQDQEQEQDSANGGSMAMEGLESTHVPESIPAITTTVITTSSPSPSPSPSLPSTTNNNFAAARPFAQPEHLEKFGWFYNPEFEGSFPSRILPFLYLGNLAHASNPGLLRSLGIQYVLSVGEQAHGLDVHMGEVGSEDKSSQFMVKLVDDMYDNGVDPLWRHIENSVAFVDEARKNNTRVLIHCRVGVSRSATIVIAYLMAHYNLSLVDAYLMVRARRLSVIIQPNLLFMYELMQWEQRLRGRFDSMGWPGIAREVHHLDRKSVV